MCGCRGGWRPCPARWPRGLTYDSVPRSPQSSTKSEWGIIVVAMDAQRMTWCCTQNLGIHIGQGPESVGKGPGGSAIVHPLI
jgi:hypothetical protein